MKNIYNIDNIEDLKKLFIKAFTIIYKFDTNNVSQKDYEEDLNNIGKFYYSENVLFYSLKNKYIIEIIIKYIDFHLNRLDNIICSYFDYFNYNINMQLIRAQASIMHKEKNWEIIQEFFCEKLNINSREFEGYKLFY